MTISPHSDTASVPSSVLGSPSSTPVCVRVGHPNPRIVTLGDDCRKRQNSDQLEARISASPQRARPAWTPRLAAARHGCAWQAGADLEQSLRKQSRWVQKTDRSATGLPGSEPPLLLTDTLASSLRHDLVNRGRLICFSVSPCDHSCASVRDLGH